MFTAIMVIFGLGAISGAVLSSYVRTKIEAYRQAKKVREEEFDKKVNEYTEWIKKNRKEQ